LIDASTSPLAHLLHPGIEIEKTDDAMLLQSLQSLAGNQLQISDMPTDYAPYRSQFDKTKKLKPRRFLGKIDRGWKVSSFSSLSSNAPSIDAADQPDYDETSFVRFPMRGNLDKDHIFSFPRGARAGTFMHALFENLDFSQPDPEIISNQLVNFGYDVEKWQTVILTLVDNVLNTPLSEHLPDFSLSRISRDKRLNELEFYYPLSSVSLQGLESLFSDFDHKVSLREESKNNRLIFAPVRGFMKGYIDMVFGVASLFVRPFAQLLL
jgi:exodeoxyribonuclease V beta subunit